MKVFARSLAALFLMVAIASGGAVLVSDLGDQLSHGPFMEPGGGLQLTHGPFMDPGGLRVS
jgi:hypothetical protein